MKITKVSINRPTLIVVIFSVLGILGLLSFMNLNYALVPKLSFPTISVTTIYPGASPSEAEELIGKKVEDAVSTLEKVDRITTNSYEGVSVVAIEFQQSADVDKCFIEAQRKVNEIISELPKDARTPSISKIALDAMPIMRIGSSANMDPKDYFQFIKDHIKPALAKVAGVGQITTVGGDEREIKININQDKLKSYGLSLLQITSIIGSSNLDIPTGKIKETDGQYVVRLAGKLNSIEGLENIIVKKEASGEEVKLGDIAEIFDGIKSDNNINRINGQNSVGLLIQKQSDANDVEVSKGVKKAIKELEGEYQNINLKFDIAQDNTTFTLDSVNAVLKDIIIAIILVAFVMFLFLHSVRNSLIVMIAIPASLISSFIGMYVMGFSFNLLTLLAMSLVIGILVDDSIVVIENIHKHLEKGEKPFIAAYKAIQEIGFAAISITMVIVIVFLPISIITGLVGKLLREFALEVVFSTLLSLFVSFTITPLLASRFSKLEHFSKATVMGKIAAWSELVYKKLEQLYLSLLKWSINNKKKLILCVLIAFIGSVSFIPLGFVGANFIPQTDGGELSVSVELPSSASIQQTNLVVKDVENILFSIPEVKKVFTNVGASSEGLSTQSISYNAELNIILASKNDRKRSSEDISAEIKRRVSAIPGLKVRVGGVSILGSANLTTPIQIEVLGSSPNNVRITADTLLEILGKIKGTSDVRLSSESGKPELKVEIDRDKLAYYGLSIAEVGGTLRNALNGNDDYKLRINNTDYDIRIQLDEFDRAKTEDVNHLVFYNRDGNIVELNQFAKVVRTTGPSKSERLDRNYAVKLNSQAVGRSIGEIAQDFKEQIKDMKFPEGVKIRYAGDLKLQSESFSDLGLAALIAVLFVYLILVALYNSYLLPFVVFFSIPMAVIGAIVALALTGNSLDIFTLLGMIMLMGLVAKNAILLVDRSDAMKRGGLSATEAVMEAGESRFRPILMTTIAMVFGMLPLAFSSSAGSEWKSGLAWVLIGGLISSLILTLVVIPIIYIKFIEIKERFSSKRKKSDTEPILIVED
jgi:hydrophobic/amphiphilic exporter-1 (mainly G- bacteria), HAE1 family